MRVQLFPNFTCHHLITHTTFLLFGGMVMHIRTNEFETKEKQKISEMKNLLQHILTMQHKRSALKAFYLILIFWGAVCHEY